MKLFKAKKSKPNQNTSPVQGFFVALLYCFFSSEVLTELRKSWRRFKMCRLRREKRSLRHCPSKITSNTFNSVLAPSIKQAPPDKQIVENRPNGSPMNGGFGRENKDRRPDRQAGGKQVLDEQPGRAVESQRPVDRGEERSIDKDGQAEGERIEETDRQQKRDAIDTGSISIHPDRPSLDDRTDPANSQLKNNLQNSQTVDGRLDIESGQT